MSDVALEWRRTASISAKRFNAGSSAVPDRKIPLTAYSGRVDDDYSALIYFKATGRLSHTVSSEEKVVPQQPAAPYPPYLAKIFFCGVLIFVFGMVVLGISLVHPWTSAKYIAWIVLTIGAAAMALSLLRAQELDPQHQ